MDIHRYSCHESPSSVVLDTWEPVKGRMKLQGIHVSTDPSFVAQKTQEAGPTKLILSIDAPISVFLIK